MMSSMHRIWAIEASPAAETQWPSAAIVLRCATEASLQFANPLHARLGHPTLSIGTSLLILLL